MRRTTGCLQQKKEENHLDRQFIVVIPDMPGKNGGNFKKIVFYLKREGQIMHFCHRSRDSAPVPRHVEAIQFGSVGFAFCVPRQPPGTKKNFNFFLNFFPIFFEFF
jgi:hypothetical protein